jgi:hypothetical protein
MARLLQIDLKELPFYPFIVRSVKTFANAWRIAFFVSIATKMTGRGISNKLLSLILIIFLAIVLATCSSNGGSGDSGPKSSDMAITKFSFANPTVTGIIDENAKTISVTVPLGTNVTSLVATFTTTGANVKVGSTVQVSGTTSNDFTKPVVYIVTAANGTTTTYTVTINVGVQSSYTTNFPLTENPISEGGKWINGGTAGLDWNDVQTSANKAWGSRTSSSYNDPTAILTGTWPSDQTVTATVFGTPTDADWNEVEIRLRSSISAHSNTGYEATCRVSNTGNAYAGWARWNGALGNFTSLALNTGSQYGCQEGDIIKATITGTNPATMTLWRIRSGVTTTLASATDSTYTTGSPGIGFYGGGAGTLGTFGLSSVTVATASTGN